MAIPAGSHYEPGSNRHTVRLPSGETVSRATAENMQAQESGFTSHYERKQAYRDMRERNYDNARQEAKERGISERAFNERAARLAHEYKQNGNSYAALNKAPDGPLAKYLAAIGRRSETADYRVGDSPKT